ncbi:MAG: hypothetical protein ACR2FY_03530, partial [Pirellulaceae bacterium]
VFNLLPYVEASNLHTMASGGTDSDRRARTAQLLTQPASLFNWKRKRCQEPLFALDPGLDLDLRQLQPGGDDDGPAGTRESGKGAGLITKPVDGGAPSYGNPCSGSRLAWAGC